MSMDELLSVDLLERLEACWRRAGALISESLRPGLSVAEMDALVAPHGLRLSDEARTWWGWHDGTSSEMVASATARAIGPNLFAYLPLRDALRLLDEQRVLAGEIAADVSDVADINEPDFWWAPTWLPFTKLIYGGAVAIELRVDAGEPSPIHVVNWENRLFRTPSAQSFAQMVLWWIEAIESGYWEFDKDERCWRVTTDERGPGGLLT